MHVRLEADWLVCKIECIPQSGTFELDVPVDRADCRARRGIRAGAGRAPARARRRQRRRARRRRRTALRRARTAGRRARPQRHGVSRNRRRRRQPGAGTTALERRHVAGALAAVGAAQRKSRDVSAGAGLRRRQQSARGRERHAPWPEQRGRQRGDRAIAGAGRRARRAEPAGLPHRAAVRLVRRRDPQPHALRVPGVVAQGARARRNTRAMRANAGAARWPTPRAWCCRSSRWPAC